MSRRTSLRWSNLNVVLERGSRKRSPSPSTRPISLMMTYQRCCSGDSCGLNEIVYLMLLVGNVYSDKLLDVVLFQGRLDALLERVVVGNDVSDIWQMSLVTIWRKRELKPFKTSLISPGGLWSRNFAAEVTRSSIARIGSRSGCLCNERAPAGKFGLGRRRVEPSN